MSVSNYLNRNCCAKCRHFYRDLIIHYTEEGLVKMKAGLCTRNAPNPVVFEMTNSKHSLCSASSIGTLHLRGL
jgi:hypothetical protein